VVGKDTNYIPLAFAEFSNPVSFPWTFQSLLVFRCRTTANDSVRRSTLFCFILFHPIFSPPSIGSLSKRFSHRCIAVINHRYPWSIPITQFTFHLSDSHQIYTTLSISPIPQPCRSWDCLGMALSTCVAIETNKLYYYSWIISVPILISNYVQLKALTQASKLGAALISPFQQPSRISGYK
jgi:hypothetical protein